MRYRNLKRVVAVSFVAAHFVFVSSALVGLQDSESATAITTCHPLYSGCVAPDTKTTSPALTPEVAPVPVCRSVESGFDCERLVRIVTDPLCTVTVSLLRATR